MSQNETPSEAHGVTRALADAVREIRYEEIPEEAREVARHSLLDFLGVALAGAHEPLVEILVREVAQGERSAQAALIGLPDRATRLSAALVNGAAAHALDFDDTHWVMNGHPTVPVLPALLALGETEGASGRALLEAFVAGVELECRLGALLGADHYAAGFHATGTLGTFGAAAACARLLGLDADGWLHALGLAGTQAAGLKSGFGTMAKPLHAGRAAAAGLLAALLARGGFTAARDVIEVPQGFAATHAGGSPAPAALERYAGHFLVRDTLFKYHAACHLTHAAIDAAARIRAEHALDPLEVESVEVRVSPVLLGVCNIPEPRTGLEGKFSLRVVPVDGTPAMRATVGVESAGRRLEAEADVGIPSADLGVQRERLRRKFLALASPRLGARAAGELADTALEVDSIASVAELLRRSVPMAEAAAASAAAP
jgi:2-methylcitrate dehydratase PrpD